jgi:hypothetical protein
MGQWVFNGPDQDILTKLEVAVYLKCTIATLNQAIRQGRFPRGRQLTAQSRPFWTGADLAAWFHLFPRLITDQKNSAEK